MLNFPGEDIVIVVRLVKKPYKSVICICARVSVVKIEERFKRLVGIYDFCIFIPPFTAGLLLFKPSLPVTDIIGYGQTLKSEN